MPPIYLDNCLIENAAAVHLLAPMLGNARMALPKAQMNKAKAIGTDFPVAFGIAGVDWPRVHRVRKAGHDPAAGDSSRHTI